MTLEPTKPVNKTGFQTLVFAKLALVDREVTEGKPAEYLLVTSLSQGSQNILEGTQKQLRA